MKPFLRMLSSHKLAVVIMLLAMHLVFVGTLAQIHLDIWQVQQRYFHTWFAWVDSDWQGWSLPIPLVGGYGIGFLLLANLSAAYLAKLRWSGRKWGIHLMHLGVIALLFGELSTSLFAKESQMRFEDGDSLHYSEDPRDWEISFRIEGGLDGDIDAVIPRSLIIEGEKLELQELGIRGLITSVLEGQEGMVSVVVDIQGVGRVHLSRWMEEDKVLDRDGRKVLACLRDRRYYKPYTLTLKSFTHEKYEGSSIDKHFASQVHLVDPLHGEDRQVVISMNSPLRHEGETFYQASFEEGGASILQVVSNPVWWLPYVSCTLVALGMAAHFVTKFRLSREGGGS